MTELEGYLMLLKAVILTKKKCLHDFCFVLF